MQGMMKKNVSCLAPVGNGGTQGIHQMDSLKFVSRSPIYVTPGRIAQSVRHLTRKSEVLGSIPGLATYFRFSFR